MKINRWYCYIMSVINSLQIGHITSGHLLVDEEEHLNCKVIISKCEYCGKRDISWIKNK